jgi:hypothetical protein
MTPEHIQSLIGSTKLYPQSVQHAGNEIYCFAKDGTQHYLLIIFDPSELALTRDNFSGEVQNVDGNTAIKWCLPSPANARKLRQLFPWTAPQPLGLKTSFGAGDRLGLAAAAHIQAARDCGESCVALVLAQQSIREMTRTQRTPDQVLDAATWGAFQENYQQPWGADADHLKTEDDVRRMVDAGFTFFTIDPSEHVDDNAGRYGMDELAQRFSSLEDGEKLAAHYLDQTFEVPDDNDEPLHITFSRDTLMRAAVKYARAVAHTQRLAQVLHEVKGGGNFDLEMSVDETATPTSVEEHYFVANELRERGIKVQSLAIRFIGDFEKGIDYKGDLKEFEARLRDHAKIARALGPYKISIHSGSDKFSVFPIFGKVCGDLVHEKTAGTWYLEALRVAARCEPDLFREICDFAAERFATDRATYHVVEDLNDLPDYRQLSDAELERVLDNNTGRQMLHVTFGSVLTDKKENGGWRFRTRIYQLLLKHEELHHEVVHDHSRRHMQALGMCD